MQCAFQKNPLLHKIFVVIAILLKYLIPGFPAVINILAIMLHVVLFFCMVFLYILKIAGNLNYILHSPNVMQSNADMFVFNPCATQNLNTEYIAEW